MRSLAIKADLSRPEAYCGRQLAAHFLRARFQLEGDAAAVWAGPARVETTELVDLVDREAEAIIAADEMLHLVVECFDWPLISMVLFQRIAASIVADLVRGPAAERGLAVHRRGDDLYVGNGKLSVSIATASPLSVLMHMGVNVKPTGAPVRIACLADLAIDSASFATDWLERLAAEYESVHRARAKVRAVGEWNAT